MRETYILITLIVFFLQVSPVLVYGNTGQPGVTEERENRGAVRSAEEILREDYPEFRLLKEVEGRFSPCGSIKRLFLLNDTTRHPEIRNRELNLNKLLAYDEERGKMIEVPYWMEFLSEDNKYDRFLLEPILSVEAKLGPWNGYFYTYDLNRNGVDEIIGFIIGGSCFFPEVYEYQDGAFVATLGYTDPSGLFCRIEFPKERQIKIYGYGEEWDILPEYPWKLYEWSEEERRYVIIKEGVVGVLP